MSSVKNSKGTLTEVIKKKNLKFEGVKELINQLDKLEKISKKHKV